MPSSFIPRDAATPQEARRDRSSGLADLLLVFGIVALAASAALALAVFFYQQYLQNQSTSQLSQLQRAEQEFQPALVKQFTRLNDRMTAAQSLLHAHIAPSAFFNVLNQVTLQTISYTSLSFDASNPSQITVTMAGVAQSVNSIALQADLLSKSQAFTNPIFSNIQRQPDGVHFDLTALVNPAVMNFSQLVTGGAAAPQSQPAAAAGAGNAAATSASTSPQGSSTSTTP